MAKPEKPEPGKPKRPDEEKPDLAMGASAYAEASAANKSEEVHNHDTHFAAGQGRNRIEYKSKRLDEKKKWNVRRIAITIVIFLTLAAIGCIAKFFLPRSSDPNASGGFSRMPQDRAGTANASEEQRVGSNVPLAANSGTVATVKGTRPRALLIVLPVDGVAEEHTNNPIGRMPSYSAAGDMWEGIRLGLVKQTNVPARRDEYFLKLATGEQVRVIRTPDGPTSADTVRRINGMLDQFECILAIGHETSTLAQETWQEIYSKKTLPVILLGPTNPRITEDDAAKENPVVLRLLPTDRGQIDQIEELMRGDSELNILVVADAGNPVYSDYLIASLIHSGVVGPRIVGTVEVSTRRSIVGDLERCRGLHPQQIVFVGMSEPAQVFVQTLERFWQIAEERLKEAKGNAADIADANATVDWLASLHLTFTDGCASSAFCYFLASPKRRPWASVTILSPMAPVGTPDSEIGDTFDYRRLGQTAILLGKTLVEDADRAKLATASGVLQAMAVKRIGEEITLTDLPSELRTLRFNSLGDNVAWKWHVYQLSHSKSSGQGQFHQRKDTH